MTASTALVPTPPAPIVERFLARVAMLRPAEWGRLDAVGQSLEAQDPISRWRRARLLGAFASAVPVLEEALTVLGSVVGTASDLARWLQGRSSPRDFRPSAEMVERARSPDSHALLAAMQRLWAIADARPGGPGAAMACLFPALTALFLRELAARRGAAAAVLAQPIARLYAPVEPVIPLASL